MVIGQEERGGPPLSAGPAPPLGPLERCPLEGPSCLPETPFHLFLTFPHMGSCAYSSELGYPLLSETIFLEPSQSPQYPARPEIGASDHKISSL